MDAELCKVLDNGWSLVLYKNPLGSYTAEAHPEGMNPGGDVDEDGGVITDDFTPTKALQRLVEKVFGNIVDVDTKED